MTSHLTQLPAAAPPDWRVLWHGCVIAGLTLAAWTALVWARLAARWAGPLIGAAVRSAPGRLRYLHRLAWYRITLGKRMPRYGWEPLDAGVTLGARERRAFGLIATSVRSKGRCADEPHYGRQR